MKQLTVVEFDNLKEQARTRFIKNELGERPTYRSIASELKNPYALNMLQWAAILVLIVLAFHTGIKQAIVAVPFSINLYQDLAGYVNISPVVIQIGTIVNIILFVLMSTSGLIYFKILAGSDMIKEKQRRSAGKKMTGLFDLGGYVSRINFEYLSPRLPGFLTWVIAIWIALVSWHGATPTSELGWIQAVIERLLPVFAEITLAYLISDIIENKQRRREQIYSMLERQLKPYDDRLSAYESDTEFLRHLFTAMQEYIPSMTTRGKNRRKVLPNAALLNNPIELDKFIRSEYKRLTSGYAFSKYAQAVLNSSDSDETLALESVTDMLQTPPNGATEWTPETLETNLKLRGVDIVTGTYKQGDVDRDYASGYKARKAYRELKKRYANTA